MTTAAFSPGQASRRCFVFKQSIQIKFRRNINCQRG
jgi:hypothetical protein